MDFVLERQSFGEGDKTRVGLGVRMNPQLRAEAQALLPAAQEHVRHALSDADDRGEPGPLDAAHQYHLRVVELLSAGLTGDADMGPIPPGVVFQLMMRHLYIQDAGPGEDAQAIYTGTYLTHDKESVYQYVNGLVLRHRRSKMIQKDIRLWLDMELMAMYRGDSWLCATQAELAYEVRKDAEAAANEPGAHLRPAGPARPVPPAPARAAPQGAYRPASPGAAAAAKAAARRAAPGYQERAGKAP